jgi:hypothetical protein
VAQGTVLTTPRYVDLRATPPPAEWGVGIDDDAIERAAARLAERELPSVSSGIATLPHDWPDAAWVTYHTMVMSVMACMWPPEGEEQWTTDIDGVTYTDAPALFGAFRRGLRLDGDDVDLRPLLDFSADDAVTFFRGHGTFQLLPERAAMLRAVSRAIVGDWSGRFSDAIASVDNDAEAFVWLLMERVPGFDDIAHTDRGALPFAKLPRLATAMISQRVPMRGLDDFPVYPDYMIPKVFRHWGVFVYQPELAATVDERRIVPADSPWEHGLRWGTVFAAERLRLAMARAGRAVTGPELDYALWYDGVLGPDADHMGEHHRTITMRY